MSRRSKGPIDRVRVLRALTRHRTGITPMFFDAPNVCDGGEPIRRLAPRIHELRKMGAPIRTQAEPSGVARYVLAGPLPPNLLALLDVDDAVADVQRATAERAERDEARREAELISRQMDEAAESPQCAIFDDWDDEAA